MEGVLVERVSDPESVDYEALFSLLRSAFASMDGRIDPPSSLHRMTVDDLRRKVNTETLVLAKLEDQLIGCMFCKPTRRGSRLYVGKVAVLPASQRRDVGRALMNEAFELAGERDLVELELETRVELVENHRVFEKLGFSEVARHRHDGYDHDTSVMMRAPVEPR